MRDFERVRAIREAYLDDAEERYFHPRPQIDSNDRRRVFEAGFNAAYDKQEAEIADIRARLEKAEPIVAAARNLIEQKGRHNTEIAYKRLADAMAKERT